MLLIAVSACPWYSGDIFQMELDTETSGNVDIQNNNKNENVEIFGKACQKSIPGIIQNSFHLF